MAIPKRFKDADTRMWEDINEALHFREVEMAEEVSETPVKAAVERQVDAETVLPVNDAGIDPDEFADLLG